MWIAPHLCFITATDLPGFKTKQEQFENGFIRTAPAGSGESDLAAPSFRVED